MATAGVPVEWEEHATAIARAALDMRDYVETLPASSSASVSARAHSLPEWSEHQSFSSTYGVTR